MFKPVSNKVNFPQMEEGVLAYWAEGDVFKKSLARNAGGQRYTFYDGPSSQRDFRITATSSPA